MHGTGTSLLYLEDPYRFEDHATVQEVVKTEDGRIAVVLDRTLFYPQGGGQPADRGHMEGVHARFLVEDVRWHEEVVYHFGRFSGPPFTPGESVRLVVDEDRRRLHCRLHTAGHLLDVALHNVGYRLPPAKGYHFPEGAYVEYEGVIAPQERESARQQIEAEANRLVQAGGPVTDRWVAPDQLASACAYVLPGVPIDRPVRVVYVIPDYGLPCGGTHVRDLRDIGRVVVKKIRARSGYTRLRYDVA